jgi:ATP-dependent 26S proteasome regulatory subunit
VSEETREEENKERERERERERDLKEEEENKKWVEEWKQTRTNSLKIGAVLERILNTISDGVVAIFFLLVSSASLFPFSSIRA